MAIQAVRYHEQSQQHCDTLSTLLVSADLRLKDWGRWQSSGNSLRELQPKSCLRPIRSGISQPPENPFAERVNVALRAHLTLAHFAIVSDLYIRRMTQHDAAHRADVSRDVVKRAAHKAKLVVIAECF
jgi:predicted DNA-binding protein (UPF0251 family)